MRRTPNRFWNVRCAASPMDLVRIILALQKRFSWRMLALGNAELGGHFAGGAQADRLRLT
jgi:hypothetical protein